MAYSPEILANPYEVRSQGYALQMSERILELAREANLVPSQIEDDIRQFKGLIENGEIKLLIDKEIINENFETLDEQQKWGRISEFCGLIEQSLDDWHYHSLMAKGRSGQE